MESASFLSSTGLEVLYPLKHQETSKYNVYPTALTIEKVSVSDGTKSRYFPGWFQYPG